MKTLKLILALSFGLFLFNGCNNDEATDTADDWIRKAVPVQVETAQSQNFVSSLSYNGSLLAIQTARIIPEMPGKIEALHVQIGDYVQKGRTLVQMDISTMTLQYKQASAGVSVAHANLLDAQKNWERVQTLHNENAVSQQQFEKMKLGLDAAQAQMSQAQAGLDLLKMQLDKATLTAPFDGVITQRGFSKGDLFSPAVMMPVFTLQDVSSIKVELQITSQEIMSIKKGQNAYLTVDYLDYPVPGSVTLVGVAADPLSKTFFVECQFNNSSGNLRAGTFGQVDISIEEIGDVMVVPKNAVIDRSHMFVVEENYAYQRDVEVLQESLKELIIGAGLIEGETYVTSGAFILTDSSLVQIED
ncbi:MAG: efflux RND transporter periplasmic adaptor subunit [Candidatus Marinimicrobia bacterium]|jgi:RND family efflux transporter MFP subunit|nr:efflux RND transporter periplasmic adaptor subunit [Candidatus Neomarinimicrobiota bacterium]MBT3681410.1 efflux RND transporter periplasmic adaptor subunit [Candidatus Neomarinimicrobiota bacterium]MBT3952242.1 efflux RND transporter periplasmic adaptor subunit [Candidatus Neomarinimicrobiota bacterium]MBT4254387.1 efflux RND transporter periplasmic adaptor subunit [Candidatus Neomarinimicrobiota bacterium]MBT4420954.1 efflux RND transporter periplasmic adaptor subunit [Candidatus Neomarini